MAQKIQLSQIQELDRQRQEYKDIPELALSLLRSGFIQPIVIRDDYVLIAGGRRKTALQAILNNQLDDEYRLPWDEIHPTIQEFIQTGTLEENTHFRFMCNVDNEQLSHLELEENVRRQNLTWQEHALAIDRIHRLRKRQAGLEGKLWAQQDTARLLGQKSRVSVTYVLTVAAALRDKDPEIWKCSHMAEALKLLTARKTNEAAQELALRTMQNGGTTLPVEFPLVEVPDTAPDVEDVVKALFKSTIDPHKPIATATEAPTKPLLQLPFTTKFLCGSFTDVFKDTENFVDHIITDPPYGIDMGNLDQQNTGMANISAVAAEHDVESNLNSFEPWLRTMYQILRPGGFCVLWCDFTHWQHLCTLGLSVGFQAQRWPLIWYKTHACMNQAADKNFTKNVECAVVLRRDNKAVLVKPQHSCVWTGSNEPERKQLSGHPFVKPFGLWQWIAEAIAIRGQTICDPFVGRGSMPLALIPSGYDVVGTEINSDHYNAFRENYFNAMSALHTDKQIQLV